VPRTVETEQTTPARESSGSWVKSQLAGSVVLVVVVVDVSVVGRIVDEEVLVVVVAASGWVVDEEVLVVVGRVVDVVLIDVEVVVVDMLDDRLVDVVVIVGAMVLLVVVDDVVVVVAGGPRESNSYAPMEQLVASDPGRANPRWSRPFTGGAAQTVTSPALIAGLPASSAMVCVGPPLLVSPAGSSNGSLLQNDVPLVVLQPAPAKPHVAPSSML
jgi:hypothetical protein